MYGASDVGFDPRTAKDANCIVVWGANPFASAPHQHKHWLKEAKARKIVIDPVRHPTAADADLHLQLFPGSDAALAFAMLHVLVREDRIDRAFLAAHTVGWDELEPIIVRCSPDWAAPITGIPVGKIEEAATIYGEGPSLLWLGQGLQRQPTGGNVFRAVGLLPAATGNLAKPGAGFLYLNGGARRGIDSDYLEAPHLRQGERRKVSHMDLVATLSDPREGAGPRHLEHQHRRLQSGPGAPASRAARRAAVPCGGRSLPHRHHRLRGLSCCRRRASWSSTIWCRRISICRCRRR